MTDRSPSDSQDPVIVALEARDEACRKLNPQEMWAAFSALGKACAAVGFVADEDSSCVEFALRRKISALQGELGEAREALSKTLQTANGSYLNMRSHAERAEPAVEYVRELAEMETGDEINGQWACRCSGCRVLADRIIEAREIRARAALGDGQRATTPAAQTLDSPRDAIK